VYFDLGQGEDYIYKGTTIFRGLNKDEVLSLSDEQKQLFSKDKVEDIFPTNYIIKVQKFQNTINKAIDEWIYFFKNSEIKDDFTAKGLSEAKEKLAYIKMVEKEQKNYNRYLDDLRYETSINNTMKYDVEQKIRKDEKGEIAKMMKNAGESIEKIKLYTGLSEVEIEQL